MSINSTSPIPLFIIQESRGRETSSARQIYVYRMSHAHCVQNRLYVMGKGGSEPGQIPYLINHGKHGHLTVRSIKLYTDGKSFP